GRPRRPLEVPAVDGGQNELAAHGPLLRRAGGRIRDAQRELRRGLRGVHVLDQQVYASLAQPRDGLDDPDRVAAESEEVVVNADPRRAENEREDVADLAL